MCDGCVTFHSVVCLPRGGIYPNLVKNNVSFEFNETVSCCFRNSNRLILHLKPGVADLMMFTIKNW